MLHLEIRTNTNLTKESDISEVILANDQWHHKSYWPIKSEYTNPTWPFSGPHKDGDLWTVQTYWPELPDSLCGDICPGKSKHSLHIHACKTIKAFSKLIFTNYQFRIRIKQISYNIINSKPSCEYYVSVSYIM